MLGSIFVPTPSVINNWDSLETLPIVETAPRSVPLSVFVRYPCESYNDRILSMKTGLPATGTLALVQRISQHVSTVDRFLADLYSKRGVSIPLLSYIEKLKKERNLNKNPPEFQSENAQQMARTLITPTIEYLKKIKAEITVIALEFGLIFQNREVWFNGKYSNSLLDQVCILIYRLAALSQLMLVKSGVINDISNLCKFLPNDDEITRSLTELRIWMLSKNSITDQLLSNIANFEENDFKTLFKFFTSYVRSCIEADDFVFPEMQYAYINMYVFLLQWYIKQQQREAESNKNKKKPKTILKGVDDDTKNFMKVLKQNYPCVLLFFDCSSDLGDIIPPGMADVPPKASIQNQPKITPHSLENHLRQLRSLYNHLSNNITAVLIHEPHPDESRKIVISLINSLHEVASTLNSVRSIISNCINHPPAAPDTEEDKKLNHFELSMKYGFKDDLNLILLVLCISRSIKEIIVSNLPLVQQYINYYVQYYIQNFAYNKLPPAIIRAAKCPPLKKILESVRSLIGSFNDAEFPINEQKKKYGKINPIVPNCAPNLSILEIARIQIQNVVNPENPFLTKKGVLSGVDLASEDKKEFDQFLEDTKFFADLLTLHDTIDVVFDQSNLFFKETSLDMHKVSFFPVRSSLPVILSEYALEYYHKPELTNALFFPLSIYDDAASTSIRYLHSRYLYEEIKAEAEICLTAIAKRISDSAFHPIWKFAAVRSLSKSMVNDFPKGHEANDYINESVSAIRIGVLLQQNQLFLLGSPIDTKTLIAERINSLMFDSINKIIQLFDRHGVLVSVAVKKLLEMLNSTHTLLLDFGLPIMPFNDTLSLVMSTDTPNSLQSRVLLSVSEHLNEVVLYDYYLLTNPFRLIPRKQPKVDFEGIHTNKFGSVMQLILEPTSCLISIENFRELFWMLDDGAIVILHNQLLLSMGEIFENFIRVYSSVQSRLTRIKNSPMISNCVEVFDRFEGAYRYFVDDDEVLELFGIMAQLGNLFAASEMMDDAYSLKRSATDMISSFILCKSPEVPDSNQSELFSLFDTKFQQMKQAFSSYTTIPGEKEIIQPFLFNSLRQFAQLLQANGNILNETSEYFLDLQTLKGFASMWSVLEFLMSLRESIHDKGKQRVFQSFGDGVQLSAAALLCFTNQIPLYNVLSIGSRIKSHMQTDFNVLKEQRVKTFIAVNDKFVASIRCAISSYTPIFDHILNRD